MKLEQFNNDFDVLYLREKQPMDWRNTVPHKQWSTVPKGFWTGANFIKC